MSNIGKDLSLAASILLKGGIVSFPTETVMGLGVVYDNRDAYERLNMVKGRPEDKPYTMMLGNIKDIEKYAYLNEQSRLLINNLLPGPLTILLPAKDNVPAWVTHNSGVIGIRVPRHELLETLLNMVKKPLLVPSANPSGQPPALISDKVFIYFNETIDYIIESKSNGNPPSTIVDMSSIPYKIVREGEITKKEIQALLKEELQ